MQESGKSARQNQLGSTPVRLYVDGEDALLEIAKKAEERGIIASVITDAGMTEFHGEPTKTCLALEPLPADIADELTGALPLYWKSILTNGQKSKNAMAMLWSKLTSVRIFSIMKAAESLCEQKRCESS